MGAESVVDLVVKQGFPTAVAVYLLVVLVQRVAPALESISKLAPSLIDSQKETAALVRRLLVKLEEAEERQAARRPRPRQGGGSGG